MSGSNSIKRPLPKATGEWASVTMYGHRAPDLDISAHPMQDGNVCVQIDLMSISLSPEQWAAVLDAVNEVAAQQVSA